MKSKTHQHRKTTKNSVCKKILFLISAFLCISSAVAQTNLLDRQLQNINQSSVTSGIIYDRVNPLADLSIFNMPSGNPDSSDLHSILTKRISR